MLIKWKEVLVALILGLVCPAVMIAAIQDTVEQPEPTLSQSQTTSPVLADDGVYIPVMLETGEIVQMELDAYLTRVVLQEMPAEFEPEALKAQAVVARTYTLRRVKTGGKHAGAAVCTDPSCCQGYCTEQAFLDDGGREDQLEKVQNSVMSTKKQVLLYNDELIEATYFACSGGRTEDALAVWGAQIPYLQATDSPGEENASHHIDTVQFDCKEFLGLLGLTTSDRPEAWIQKITYTAGGGVDTMRICGTDFSGTKLRQILGLRSTAFVISVVGQKVTITTKGFGHRVGMSQYGAEAMAVAGSDYRQILAHYYKGTSLSEYSG